MVKLIPLSLVIMTIAMPAYLAGKPNPTRALRRLYPIAIVYVALWAYLCINVYTKYVFVE